LLKKDYVRLREEGKIIPDGSNVKVVNNHGAISKTFPE